VQLTDLAAFDSRLKELLLQNPGRFLPVFEEAAKEAAIDLSSFPAQV
jgi:hypothetical protein